jgi:hypothetical protein
MERAGHNPHLKSHIHEVLVKDVRNVRKALQNKNHTQEDQ